jgi:amino acid transporter
MSEVSLKRVVVRWQIVGLGLNDVIGSGVFLLPASAVALLGPFSLWAVLLAGLAVLLLVLCFAEASSYFDRPGSAYLYARTAFGELVGLEVGWMTWLARVASVASLSAGFALALSYLWPALEGGWPRALAITLPLVLLATINVVGVGAGVNTAVVLLAAKLMPLLFFVGVGLFSASYETLSEQPAGTGELGRAALLLLFAYAGFENTPASAGEYRNPKRDVPFALVLNIGLITLLYFGVQWVTLGTLPAAGESSTPLADAAEGFLGSWAGLLLTAGAAVSILGTNSNTVLAGPLYLLALAQDGFGPRFLARLHPRYRTPAAAVILQAAIALPLALTGSFVSLVALSVIARLVTYIGTAAAVPVLRQKLRAPEGAFRIPGGPVIPIAAVLLSIGLASSARWSNLVAGGAALVVGLVIYRFRRQPIEEGDTE